jgi:epoxyqueuosine reductase QueG
VAVPLNPHVVAGIAENRFAEYRPHVDGINRRLNETVRMGAELLRDAGHRAMDIIPTGIVIPGTLVAPYQNKTTATRAGLAWIGKCALAITPEYGSAIRLGTILTDAPLPLNEQINESRCGACRACVEACPGGAPTGVNWKLGMSLKDYFDQQACIRGMVSIMNKEDGVLGGGRCIVACPYTRNYLQRHGALPGGEAAT